MNVLDPAAANSAKNRTVASAFCTESRKHENGNGPWNWLFFCQRWREVLAAADLADSSGPGEEATFAPTLEKRLHCTEFTGGGGKAEESSKAQAAERQTSALADNQAVTSRPRKSASQPLCLLSSSGAQ